MTGPQHYSEAELLLKAANRKLAGNEGEWLNTMQRRAELRAEAQVHATLALAAAYAEVNPTSMWHEVAGTKPADGEA